MRSRSSPWANAVLNCSLRSLRTRPQLPGHTGDHHTAFEQQPCLEPQGALVVEQLFPGAPDHVLRDVDNDQGWRVGGTKLSYVVKNWAGDIPIRRIDDCQQIGRASCRERV